MKLNIRHKNESKAPVLVRGKRREATEGDVCRDTVYEAFLPVNKSSFLGRYQQERTKPFRVPPRY